LCVKFLMI